MKEIHALETLLQSWELRRPSAALNRRLFHPAARRRPPVIAICRWLAAPAAACALLALAVFHPENGIPAGATGRPMVAMIASNQTPADGFSNASLVARSNFAVGFQWTNRSDATSSLPTFLPAR